MLLVQGSNGRIGRLLRFDLRLHADGCGGSLDGFFIALHGYLRWPLLQLPDSFPGRFQLFRRCVQLRLTAVPLCHGLRQGQRLAFLGFLQLLFQGGLLPDQRLHFPGAFVLQIILLGKFLPLVFRQRKKPQSIGNAQIIQ